MPRLTASWRGKVIADSDEAVELEGNCYFPEDSVARQHLLESETRTACGWKGTAHYFDIVVDGIRNRDAAWQYPDPLPAAESIRGHIAFWRGVQIGGPPD